MFIAITTSYSTTCGLKSDGTAYCWGLGSNGQMGNGSNVATNLQPVAVSGGHTFISLSAANQQICGMKSDGSAYCWGYNNWGQLGIGSITDQNTPVAVNGGLDFEIVSAGAMHTCGLLSTGKAYCWGSNFNGRLGDNTIIDKLTPVAVTQ